MTITERTSAAREWIDSQLALCNAATGGPWETDLESTHPAVFDEKGVFIATDVWSHDAAFIAAARTGYPEMLEGMKAAMEAATERLQSAIRETLEESRIYCQRLRADNASRWNAALAAALKTLPGGTSCDPQQIADGIRALAQ